jgi:hypothetical protein
MPDPLTDDYMPWEKKVDAIVRLRMTLILGHLTQINAK